MKNTPSTFLAAALAVFIILLTDFCQAHDGRRFRVGVDNGKLVAQGVNTKTPLPLGETAVRPYANVIHDHWTNYAFNNVDTAVSLLPGFDIPASESLLRKASLTLTVNRIYRWENPPTDHAESMIPSFSGPPAKEFKLSFGGNTVGSATGFPDSVHLATSIPAAGLQDLDPNYRINTHVTDSIYVVDMILSTTAENVADSDTIYAILAPPGMKYHHTALFLEKYLSENPASGPNSETNLSSATATKHASILTWLIAATLGAIGFVAFIRSARFKRNNQT